MADSFKSWQGRYKKGAIILLDNVPHLLEGCLKKLGGRWELVLERLRKHRDVHEFASEWQRLPLACRSLLTLHVKETWSCFVVISFLEFGCWLFLLVLFPCFGSWLLDVSYWTPPKCSKD